MANFKEQINYILKKYSLTKKEVAKELGLTEQYFGQLCNGNVIPSFDKAVAIFNGLNHKVLVIDNKSVIDSN